MPEHENGADEIPYGKERACEQYRHGEPCPLRGWTSLPPPTLTSSGRLRLPPHSGRQQTAHAGLSGSQDHRVASR